MIFLPILLVQEESHTTVICSYMYLLTWHLLMIFPLSFTLKTAFCYTPCTAWLYSLMLSFLVFRILPHLAPWEGQSCGVTGLWWGGAFWDMEKCIVTIRFCVLWIPVLKSSPSKISTVSCPVKKNGKWAAETNEKDNGKKANYSYFHIIQKDKIAWANMREVINFMNNLRLTCFLTRERLV